MIDAKHFTEKEIDAILKRWAERGYKVPRESLSGITDRSIYGIADTGVPPPSTQWVGTNYIDIPGVGVVGSSSRPEDICVTCTVGKHSECSKFTTHGDMCQCPCNKGYRPNV